MRLSVCARVRGSVDAMLRHNKSGWWLLPVRAARAISYSMQIGGSVVSSE